MCVLLLNLIHVIHIPSFRIVNLLSFGGHFSNMTFIDAKSKYKSPYLLNISQPYLQNHIRTFLGRPGDVSDGRRQNTPLGVTDQTIWVHPFNVCRNRPQDVGKGRALALHIGHYGGVLRTLYWDVLRTSYFNIQRTSVEDVLRMSLGDFLWRYIEGHMGTSIGRLLGTSSGRPWDVILPSGKEHLARSRCKI